MISDLLLYPQTQLNMILSDLLTDRSSAYFSQLLFTSTFKIKDPLSFACSESEETPLLLVNHLPNTFSFSYAIDGKNAMKLIYSDTRGK